MFRIAQFDISRKGRFEVCGELRKDGDNVPLAGKVFEGGKRWLYGNVAHGRENGGNLQILN